MPRSRTAVPAGVQLVDDDVGLARTARAPRRAGRPRRSSSSTGSRSHASITCSRPLRRARRRRVHHERPRPFGRRHRRERAQVDARRDHVRLRHPPERVVGADDLRACALRRTRAPRGSCRGCPSRGSGRPSSCRAPAGAGTAPTSARASARSRSGRRRCGAGAARTPATASPAPDEPAATVERPVGLRMQPLALEDDEPRVDSATSQRLHVLPRDPRDVDRAVRDAEAHRAAHRGSM